MVKDSTQESGEIGANGVRVKGRRSSATHCQIAGILRGFGILIEDLILKGEEIIVSLESVGDNHRMRKRGGKKGGLLLGKCCWEKLFKRRERYVLKGKKSFQTFLEAFEKKK